MKEPFEALHLDARSLEAYRSRTMDPPALLAAADHLAECPECRARAGGDPPAIGHLRRTLEPSHLSEAELEAFAEDSLSDPIACEHLAECATCRDDAHDLRRFVRTDRHVPQSWWRLPAAAALVCASLGAGWLFVRVKPATVVPVVAVGLPQDLRELRDAAVSTGRIVLPADVAALRGPRETQLGNGVTQSAIQLETPLGTGTMSARPEFRWQAVARAQSYELAVFDNEYRPVAKSGVLHDTRWVPAQDLTEGVVYVWELTVSVDGTRRTAPVPPAPSARFLILPTAERKRLAEIAARYPQEHLLLGVLFGNAGALDGARRELRAAATPEAERLLLNLTAR